MNRVDVWNCRPMPRATISWVFSLVMFRSFEEHLAAGGRIEAADDAQDGALAGPVGPDDAEDLALADLEAQVVDGDQAAEVLADVLDPQEQAPRLWLRGGQSAHRLSRAGRSVALRRVGGASRRSPPRRMARSAARHALVPGRHLAEAQQAPGQEHDHHQHQRADDDDAAHCRTAAEGLVEEAEQPRRPRSGRASRSRRRPAPRTPGCRWSWGTG